MAGYFFSIRKMLMMAGISLTVPSHFFEYRIRDNFSAQRQQRQVVIRKVFIVCHLMGAFDDLVL